ncbi:MAG: hypothetical protein KF861_15670 [Planctomycetaceae bacterium]|nr:hypothetical protein [Planctomycetaceae bacterium]
MADRPLKLHELRKLLKKFDAWDDASRGRGSHTMFFRVVEGREFSYPIPTNKPDVAREYVKGIRQKFRLTTDDGVTDRDFYG